jgi:hypothetical protein
MAEEEENVQMTKYQRYYALHRDAKLSKYHNNPDVIAKKEQRERQKAEKEEERKEKQESEKAAKKAEKEKQRQQKMQLALATRKITKTSDNGLGDFLVGIPPVGDSGLK